MADETTAVEDVETVLGDLSWILHQSNRVKAARIRGVLKRLPPLEHEHLQDVVECLAMEWPPSRMPDRLELALEILSLPSLGEDDILLVSRALFDQKTVLEEKRRIVTAPWRVAPLVRHGGWAKVRDVLVRAVTHPASGIAVWKEYAERAMAVRAEGDYFAALAAHPPAVGHPESYELLILYCRRPLLSASGMVATIEDQAEVLRLVAGTLGTSAIESFVERQARLKEGVRLLDKWLSTALVQHADNSRFIRKFLEHEKAEVRQAAILALGAAAGEVAQTFNSPALSTAGDAAQTTVGGGVTEALAGGESAGTLVAGESAGTLTTGERAHTSADGELSPDSHASPFRPNEVRRLASRPKMALGGGR